ncbi:MAG: hypothetical protein WBD07_15450 [Vicinamibacterales bacterium]
MATATVDTCIGEKAADVYRKATHLAGEARELTNLATDAVGDGVHAARRAVHRGIENAAELRETTLYRVKRNPVKALGVAFAAGVFLGAVVGAFGRRRPE